MISLWPRFVVGLLSLRARELPQNATHLPGATEPLCRVLAPDDGTPIDIWEITGNRRAVSFEDALSYESQAQCTGEAPTCEPLPAAQREVRDVADCPQCPCEANSTDIVTLSQSCEALAEQIATRCAQAGPGKSVDILMLGLGGGTLHTHTRRHCPAETRVRSVEIDPRLAAVASRYFGLPLEPGVSEVVVDDALDVVRREAAAARARATGPVRTSRSSSQALLRVNKAHAAQEMPLPSWAEDANRGLEEELRGSDGNARTSDLSLVQSDDASLGGRGWDVIVVDCFVGMGRTPESCRSAEFIGDARAALAPGGVVLHHLWHSSPKVDEVSVQYQQAMADYKSVFGPDSIQVVPVPRDPRIMFDDVIVARNAAASS